MSFRAANCFRAASRSRSASSRSRRSVAASARAASRSRPLWRRRAPASCSCSRRFSSGSRSRKRHVRLGRRNRERLGRDLFWSFARRLRRGRGASRDRGLPLVAGERRRPIQHHDEALLNVVFQVLARGAHREILPSCGRSSTSLEVLAAALPRARDRRVPRDETVDVLERRQRSRRARWLVHVNTRVVIGSSAYPFNYSDASRLATIISTCSKM